MEILVNSISLKVAGLCIQNELVYQMLMKLAALKGDMLNIEQPAGFQRLVPNEIREPRFFKK